MSLDPGIQSNQNPDPSIVIPSQFPIIVNNTPVTNPTLEITDEISASAAAQIASIIDAQFPNLERPGAATTVGLAVQLETTQHDIIMSMLDNWLEGIAEQKKLRDEEAKKDDIERRDLALYEMRKTLNDFQDDPNESVITLGLVFAATTMITFMPALDTNVATNPILDMSVRTLTPIVPDIAVQMGIIGAVYALGLQMATLGQLTSESIKENSQPDEKSFAKGYAENVLALLGTASFNTYLAAIVTNAAAKGEPLTNEQATPLINLLRLVLLASALAMLYKAKTGGLTGKEFGAMVEGEIPAAKGSIEGMILQNLRGVLGMLGSNEKNQALKGLISYMDKNPSVFKLADSASVLQALYTPVNHGDAQV